MRYSFTLLKRPGCIFRQVLHGIAPAMHKQGQRSDEHPHREMLHSVPAAQRHRLHLFYPCICPFPVFSCRKRITSPTVSKVVTAMSKEDFRNEKLYQTTMHLARKMLEKGIISEEEYRQIDTIFLEKYKPVFGTLFSDISLTSGA